MKRLATVLSICVLLLTACTSGTVTTARTVFALDTVVRVTVYEGEAAALEDCFAELTRLENLLSATREGSDIARVNAANGEPVVVSSETVELLTLSNQVASLSGGAFDVTIRPVTELWDFSAEQPGLPDPDALAQACARVDYRKLCLSENTVQLSDGGLEPGGVAKGYIADRLRDTLVQQGVTSALLDLGGNIVVVGDKQGSPFRIGIKDPASPSDLAAILQVRDRSVVTSGTYERGFTLNGVRYHHLLDPTTGMPVQNELASVTIVAERSALADALSTACFVLGETDARVLLAQYPGVEALFIHKDGRLSATNGLIADEAGEYPPQFRVKN